MEHLLLLHGAMGAKEQLTAIADHLREDFTVQTLSFSGHGGQPMPEKFSIPGFADDILRYLDQHQVAQTHIFGYSMGGYVALHLANHSSRLKKIITLATKFHWDREIARKEAGMLDPAVIREKVPQFAAQLERRHQPNDWEAVLNKTKNLLTELGEDKLLSLAVCPQVLNPCLLLLGDRDKMITREETLAMANALPNARMEIIPDTGHPLEQADPVKLAKIVSEFLQQREA